MFSVSPHLDVEGLHAALLEPLTLLPPPADTCRDSTQDPAAQEAPLLPVKRTHNAVPVR